MAFQSFSIQEDSWFTAGVISSGDGGGLDPSFGNTRPKRLSTPENVEWTRRYPPI